MERYHLSDHSKKFMDDLRLYLFSSGKNDQEINEIAEELEIHLIEAEKHGKSIEQIVGTSPKEYMKNISNEMKTDYRVWVKYVPLIVIGTISFSILGDLLEGPLSYSLLQIIGTVLFSILFIGGVFITFRYVASNRVSRLKEFLIMLLPVMISLIFFWGLIAVNSIYKTPTINFNWLVSIIIGLIVLSFVVLFSIWSKTAVMLVVLIALHLPPFVLSFTSFGEEVQLIFGMVLTYLLIGIYLFLEIKKLNRKK
ncbi:hypothetical protein LIS82_27230 (plasmid) [Cytobacillus solani]|uniref:HAAS domain-containing protein n=1 Tax=Cytobacillus solani TaxID=1637975 RepID=UPI0020793726|nr:hypothetical protein [Cytobacillus solani]USK57898.1 hypothetical protein LIS82_27230 [Cytobacillus solani]